MTTMTHDEQGAFASLKSVREETREAEAIYERLHNLVPGDKEYDEIRDALADDDDPEASTRCEIASLVRFLFAFVRFLPFACA